jgi:tripartite-type tricarboxylate transporter receptor subunit TctC
MKRRSLLATSAASAAALALPGALRAQSGYPNKPIKLIVGFPPGGGIDFTARQVQPGLEAALGQPVVIEYKPGAGGVIAATELTRTAPDGYTLLVANVGPFAIAPSVAAKKPYDPVTQFSYIGQIAETSYIAATRPEHPARDLKQFAEWARANAGKVSFASGGIGSSTHLCGELLNSVAGLDMLHVPYKGSAPAVTDLIGGQVHLLIDAGTVLLPQIKGGRLKALAVTGTQRDANIPAVPTVRELGMPGMEAAGWQGLVGPAGLPREVVERVAAALRQTLANADVRARFAEGGATVNPRPAAEFAAHVKAEAERWGALIAQRGIKVD